MITETEYSMAPRTLPAVATRESALASLKARWSSSSTINCKKRQAQAWLDRNGGIASLNRPGKQAELLAELKIKADRSDRALYAMAALLLLQFGGVLGGLAFAEPYLQEGLSAHDRVEQSHLAAIGDAAWSGVDKVLGYTPFFD